MKIIINTIYEEVYGYKSTEFTIFQRMTE